MIDHLCVSALLLAGAFLGVAGREITEASFRLRGRPERRHGRCPRSCIAVRPADIRKIIRDLETARPGDRVARTLRRQLGINARPRAGEPHYLRFTLGTRACRAVREMAARLRLEVRP